MTEVARVAEGALLTASGARERMFASLWQGRANQAEMPRQAWLALRLCLLILEGARWTRRAR